MDYFRAVGGLGLGSRLKRLSDAYMGEVKQLYTEKGLDFEPRWFPLYSLLFHSGPITVTAAALELRLTHPHISTLAKELCKAGLVTLKANPDDARSRTLCLTPKGRKLAEQVQPLWGGIQRAVDDIIRETDPAFLRSLERMEQLLREKSFSQRVRGLTRAKMSGACRIVEYKPDLKAHFVNLNRQWIEKHFVMESHDRRFFANPEKEIIERGGEIIFAELGGEIIGTVALIPTGTGYELAKLAVSDKARGKGVGQLLTQEIMARAKKKGAKSLTLTTHTCLVAAVQLYKKLGFVETHRGSHSRYRRVNLVMEKVL
ncbi:MAG TPA: bifunctional helix-turn-helix transcriptional regulator/GNAT family N-acetyltransferase [Bdellovibrionota bacterium]|nr:bifunctional helix-turn-helix transcriptional regulator/GNAT family N-acetyltransferase [Bdellovibrionota bacterium]